jgi:arabinofuranosyltransferase
MLTSRMHFINRIQLFYKSIPKHTKILSVLGVLSLLWGVNRAIIQHWICDDAFISFRYALNLRDGLGLVFNEGEFVEGYTNFLWTIFLYIGMNFSIPPERTSQFLGLLFYAGSITSLLVFFYSYNNLKQLNYFIPFSAMALALQPHAQIYATGGLETSSFGFFLLVGYLVIWWNYKTVIQFLGFFLLGLAALSRPEGFLFYGWALVYATLFKLGSGSLFDKILKWTTIQIPMLFLLIPYLFWKEDYYGNLLPNTFYAKSGDTLYLRQGIKYLLLYFNSYYTFYLFGLVVFFKYLPDTIQVLNEKISKQQMQWKKSKKYKEMFTMVVPKKKPFQFRIPFLKELSNIRGGFFLLFFPPTIGYTIYLGLIGGDFMFARLLTSLSGIYFLSVEVFLLEKVKRKSRIVISILLLISLPLYNNPYKGTKIPIVEGITEESSIYKIQEIYKLKQILLPLRQSFQNANISIAFSGSQAMYAYYLNPPVAIEISTGLTDATIANQKLKKRGRIGHEKTAPMEYLKNRGVHLHLFEKDLSGRTEYNLFTIKGLNFPFRILKYENQSMKFLKKSSRVEFVDFPNYLDEYILRIGKTPLVKIEKDYSEFNEYYFKYNLDLKRENHFLNYISD